MYDRNEDRWNEMIGHEQRQFGGIHDVVIRSLNIYEWCEFHLLSAFNAPSIVVERIKARQAHYIYDGAALNDAVEVLGFSARLLGFADALLVGGSVDTAQRTLDMIVALGQPYCSLVGRTLAELHAKGPNFHDCPRIVKFGGCSIDMFPRISELLLTLGFTSQYTTSLGGLLEADETTLLSSMQTEPLLFIRPVDPKSLKRGAHIAWL